MSNQMQKLEKERELLFDIGQTIRAAKKNSLPMSQVLEYTLGAIMKQYEMRGDVEVKFKNVPGRAPSSKILAVNAFAVRRPEKSVPKKKTYRDTEPSTPKPSTTEAPKSKPPTKAPAKAPAKAPTHVAPPSLKASNTTVTLYKAPAYVAPTNKGLKYELSNFKIRKYKSCNDKTPTDSTDASLVGSSHSAHSTGNPRKRKAPSELSDRPRQRMAPGASSPAAR